uniref:Hint domain-containing protein n=1 Tax=Attheya septentrionalis TaxID=420275 RepID=A0A7S2XSW2_9STRA|mmetsp:Transcript_6470/g.11543  ORF Transcript_6470/g.11543 Transcript_6470/m.11543 type:complete len:558 (+) Transcript_6470:245-1918(+)|eukprot:CAMPEP_0198302864 /NCGR_PEP_ID=MMETSP1449-20131203/56584_1 /TAXON_ID=420275 /ORGANISM="Attheya septentrionalis, Strain CCMP2084" /LENGTH=557 /DNA_ID=CAMNT_0044005335 /DNA_START=223 /DNA_END=1896 /DNA_ORIENTATION=-
MLDFDCVPAVGGPTEEGRHCNEFNGNGTNSSVIRTANNTLAKGRKFMMERTLLLIVPVLVTVLVIGRTMMPGPYTGGDKATDGTLYNVNMPSTQYDERDLRRQTCISVAQEIEFVNKAGDFEFGTVVGSVPKIDVEQAWKSVKTESTPIRVTTVSNSDSSVSTALIDTSLARRFEKKGDIGYDNLHINGLPNEKYSLTCRKSSDECKVILEGDPGDDVDTKGNADSDDRGGNRRRLKSCTSNNECPCTCLKFKRRNLCGGCGCFSPLSTITVDGRGIIPMKDLKVNDKVLTSKSAMFIKDNSSSVLGERGTAEHRSSELSFQRVYAFSHWSHTAPTRFLQIYTTAQKDPLEITPDHLLYVQEDSSYPVPAGSLKVGDLLVGTSFPPPRVIKIESVIREGLFLPFTYDGTIVVDKVLASNYVSLAHPPEDHYHSFFQVDEVPIISYHLLSHVWQTPHRLVCMWFSNTICKASASSEYESFWARTGRFIAEFVFKKPAIIKGPILASVVGFLLPLYFMEQIGGLALKLAVLAIALAIVLRKKPEGDCGEQPLKKEKNFI